VQRYVEHRGGDGGRADDIVAETFVVAWRRLADVLHDQPLPWLFAVARNVWLNQRRGDRRYAAAARRLPRSQPAPPPAEPFDSTPVRRALAALDTADREILSLVAWEGLSAAQIGEVLGCSAGAARMRLHRARHHFAAELARRTPADGQNRYESQLLGEARDDRA
jgi:RNA polymerase sigma-70 factor (ECF subfamily)